MAALRNESVLCSELEARSSESEQQRINGGRPVLRAHTRLIVLKVSLKRRVCRGLVSGSMQVKQIRNQGVNDAHTFSDEVVLQRMHFLCAEQQSSASVQGKAVPPQNKTKRANVAQKRRSHSKLTFSFQNIQNTLTELQGGCKHVKRVKHARHVIYKRKLF